MNESARADSLMPRKTSTGEAAGIEDLIADTLDAMGYRIVRVILGGGTRQLRLQIMVEHTDGRGMNVDHCAEVSRAVEAILDEADPIGGAYDLEVSSPGIDRPLTRPGDFETWAGFQARVEMLEPFGGRRRFKGKLLGIRAGAIRLDVDGTDWALPFAGIEKAKLVLTDDLIAATENENENESTR